ncbi:type II toxin-antitoxin system Phd/YefM family antitoxin [Pseudomonas asiatica]|uniref:type II toxin-antitoxin system Phd/YefM family antitoxin n=1 Tax=Pseudomonas asiatica TaxID=2219225 RepID=UPI003BA0FA6B|nr:type II toxin-antitoxin system Phd/YefM family antitoxin [Pseudomonas shirazica]
MYIVKLKKVRHALGPMLDEVCRDRVPLVIVRKRGKPVVVLPLSDFNGYQETMYLLGSTANAQRLKTSAAQLRSFLHRAK